MTTAFPDIGLARSVAFSFSGCGCLSVSACNAGTSSMRNAQERSESQADSSRPLHTMAVAATFPGALKSSELVSARRI